MRTTVPTSLTAAQLEGLACVECGSDSTEQQPTGDRAPSGAQLFRCADLSGCRIQQSIDAHFPALAALRDEQAASGGAVTADQIGRRLAARVLANVPSLAAKTTYAGLADALSTALTQSGLEALKTAPCPDGRSWCTGAADDHDDPREHIHHGLEHSMSGSYGLELMAAYLVQMNDDDVRLAFVSNRNWPDLDLDQADELINDMAAHLEQLRALRAQMAALLNGTAL